MSLFNTLGTGASGLTASGASLSVIGDNIANVGTTGFKASRAYFADVFPGIAGTAGGPAKLGRGAMLGGISTQFQQGALESTGGVLDVALAGGGFLPVRGADGEIAYTRDGAFQLDRTGAVVNLMGANVQGYSASDGQLGTTVGDLVLDIGPLPHQATDRVTMNLTLQADDGTGALSPNVDYAAVTLDGTEVGSLNAAGAAADFSTSVTVYDSLGVAHDVQVNWVYDGNNTWTWSAVTDASTVDTDGDGTPDFPTPSSPADAAAFEIASGTVSFDTDGALTGFTQAQTTTAWNWPGAGTFEFDLDVGMDANGVPTDGAIAMSGADSFTTSVTQDGRAQAGLVDLSVAEDGTIQGVYANGDTRVLGAFAVATFGAEQGLERIGGNLFRATHTSGEPAIGLAGTGGRGSLVSRSLERSTTDLETEFIGMIQAQRSFQANAGVIRTADETLQELVNLV